MVPASARRPRLRSVLLLLPVALASGCGGGSGGGSAADTAAPTAGILFPPPGLLAEGGAITVRGKAADDTGVQAVRVNGLLAATANGFVDWEATVVPVLSSSAEWVQLTVETEDVLGNVDTAAAQTTVEFRRHVFGEVVDVTFDPGRDRALVMDGLPARLVKIDTQSGDLEPVQNTGPGVQPDIPRAAGIALHAGPDEVLVTESQLGDLFGIDVPSGAQRLVSLGATVGTRLRGVAVDPPADRAFVMDDQPWTPLLLEVDLSTGVRNAFSAPWHQGPPLEGGGGLALEPGRNRILVAVTKDPGLIAVDLSNGERAFLSGTFWGSGPAFSAPTDVVLDLALDRAYVTDRGARAVFAVDLATGDRSVLSDDSTGAGPGLVEPVGVALDLDGNPLVADAGLDALVVVDAASGDRTVIPDRARGLGPVLGLPTALAQLGGGFVVSDSKLGAVVFVEGTSGDRSLLSGASVGAGPLFADPVDVLVDGAPPVAPERIYVLDAGSRAILSVDPGLGDRAVISDDATGTGPPFAGPRSFALRDPPVKVGYATRAFVADVPLFGPPSIVEVDLGSGNRVVVSSGGRLSGPTALAYDAYATQERLLVVDPVADALVAVDPASGAQTVLSAGWPAGTGPAFGPGPADVVRDPGSDRAIVALSGLGGLLAVDLTTGARTLLTDPAGGTGWHGEPTGLVLHGGLDQVTLVDGRRSALLRVDLGTGSRAVLSK